MGAWRGEERGEWWEGGARGDTEAEAFAAPQSILPKIPPTRGGGLREATVATATSKKGARCQLSSQTS